MAGIDLPLERLSQRELRNESGKVLRAVRAGRSFLVTNGGEPVGRLVPLDQPSAGLPITRPARRRGGWRELSIQRRSSQADTESIVDELREERF